MTGNFVSIRQILDGIMLHPLMQDMTLETAVRYAVDFMRIVGAPFMFQDKFETLEIRDHMAQLPCDFYEMIQAKDEHSGVCYRCATGTFHSDVSSQLHEPHPEDPTYKVQGSKFISSIRNGHVRIAYHAMEVDEDGFPTLPDNSAFITALEAYIKKQWFTMLFDMGKVNYNVLTNVQQEYAWAVGRCCVEDNRITLDRAESLKNMLTTLIPHRTEHRHGYESLGAQEQLRLH